MEDELGTHGNVHKSRTVLEDIPGEWELMNMSSNMNRAGTMKIGKECHWSFVYPLNTLFF